MEGRGHQQDLFHAQPFEHGRGVHRVVVGVAALPLLQNGAGGHAHHLQQVGHDFRLRPGTRRRTPGHQQPRRLAGLEKLHRMYQAVRLLVEITQCAHVCISADGSADQHDDVRLGSGRQRFRRIGVFQNTHQVVREHGGGTQVEPAQRQRPGQECGARAMQGHGQQGEEAQQQRLAQGVQQQ